MARHIQDRYNVDLDTSRYRSAPHLQPEDDADADGTTNLEEWREVVRRAQKNNTATSGLLTATEYAKAALNPNLPVNP